jgi:hypothetical protein
MRPWARRTAMTTLVAVAFAAAGGGLSGTALAGTGGGGNSGVLTALGGNGVLAPVSVPADVCGDAGGLLGIALAGCRGGAVASFEKRHATASTSDANTERPTDSSASTVPPSNSLPSNGLPSNGLQGAAGPGPDLPAFRQAFSDTLNAPGPGAGTTDNPAASQPAGLGTLPGLADLPSLRGLANLPARSGAPGSSTLMATSALGAADAPGMSSDSFAALAIGALLAGAAALKIASRRTRDRKAGIGATI